MGISLDYPWMVTVTLACADTLLGGGKVDIPGLSMASHSYSGICGYSDKGGRVDIPGLSMDGHCYSGIHGYSDKGGGGEGWTFLDYPWMVTVKSGIHGYSDKGGGEKGGHPWTIHGWSRLLWHPQIL